MKTVGGIQRPKNENLSNIVDRERETIRMRQEPCDAGTSKKRKVFWTIGILAPIAVCVLLLTLPMPR